MIQALCVGCGGFLGAVLRYLMGMIPYEGAFPLVTFLVNFIGAAAIGVITELSSLLHLNGNLSLFLRVGVCGGFTTFSTFSLETLNLLQEKKYVTGGAYAVLSLLVCVLGVWLGKTVTRALLRQAA